MRYFLSVILILSLFVGCDTMEPIDENTPVTVIDFRNNRGTIEIELSSSRDNWTLGVASEGDFAIGFRMESNQTEYTLENIDGDKVWYVTIYDDNVNAIFSKTYFIE